MTCLDCKYFHHAQNVDDGYDEVLPGVLTPKLKTIPRHCEKHPELFKKLWEQNKNKLSSEVETPECFEGAITPITEMIDKMNDLLDKIKEKNKMTLKEIKIIDMDKTDFESEEKFQYCKGLQEGAEVAERAMKHRASHFVEVALQQIQKKHGIELNVEEYLKNLIYMMEWNDETYKGDYSPTDKKYDAEMIRRAQRYVGALIDNINEGYPEIKLDAHGILINLEYDMQEDDQGRRD